MISLFSFDEKSSFYNKMAPVSAQLYYVQNIIEKCESHLGNF